MNLDNIIVNKEEKKPCELTLNIEVPATEIDAAFSDVKKKFYKNAQLPGFRAGKAPKALIAKQFADRINQEAKETVGRKCMEKLFSSEEVKPVDYPKVFNETDIAEGKDFTCTYVVEVEPTFEIPAFDDYKIEREEITVTDDEVEAQVNEFLNAYKSFAEGDADHAVVDGDMIECSYEADFGEELPEGCDRFAKAEKTWLICGQPEMLPGSAEFLKGAKVGETLTTDVNFPEDFYVEGMRGKSANYSINIIKVQTSVIPELNDEFFAKIGVENEEQLRDAIKSQYHNGKIQQNEQQLADEIVNELLSRAGEFAVPAGQVAKFKEEDEKRQNLKLEGEELAEFSVKRLRIHYLIKKIAERDEVSLSDQEFSYHISRIANERQIEVMKFINEIKKSGEIRAISEQLVEQKTIFTLISKVAGAPKMPNAEDAEEVEEAEEVSEETAEKVTEE